MLSQRACGDRNFPIILGGLSRPVAAFTGLPPHIHKAVVEAYIWGALFNEIDAEDFSTLVEPWLDDDGRGSFYRQFAQVEERFTADVEPMFGDIRCPVTIPLGADDPWIPVERGQVLHARIPQASFHSFPGVGHMPQLESPSQVLNALSGSVYIKQRLNLACRARDVIHKGYGQCRKPRVVACAARLHSR